VSSSEHGPPAVRTYVDGEALEVRLAAAQSLLSDERDREQSLNTRAIAVGVAAAVLMGLVARPIESLVGRHHTGTVGLC